MLRAGNLAAFMCRLSWNLGTSPSWNLQGLSRPVQGLLCFTKRQYIPYRVLFNKHKDCCLLGSDVVWSDINTRIFLRIPCPHIQRRKQVKFYQTTRRQILEGENFQIFTSRFMTIKWRILQCVVHVACIKENVIRNLVGKPQYKRVTLKT